MGQYASASFKRGIAGWLVIALAAILIVLGAALFLGGAWLIGLGGSWYLPVGGRRPPCFRYRTARGLVDRGLALCSDLRRNLDLVSLGSGLSRLGARTARRGADRASHPRT